MQLGSKEFKEEINIVEILAAGYESLTVEILKNGNPAEEQDPSPQPDNEPAEKTESPNADDVQYVNGIMDHYYRVSFSGMDEDSLDQYLNSITEVTLNGIECENVASFWMDENSYKISENDSGNALDGYIDFTEDCFGTEEIEVKISAEGHKDLTFTVLSDKTIK